MKDIKHQNIVRKVNLLTKIYLKSIRGMKLIPTIGRTKNKKINP